MSFTHRFRPPVTLLLAGTALCTLPAAGWAQTTGAAASSADAIPAATPVAAAPAASTVQGTTRSIAVEGSQRIEPETVRSYVKLRVGATYTREDLDQAIRDLFATELFADARIRDDNGALTIVVRENPVINRIVFEGAKRIKEDKLSKELKLAPRQIFTRSRVRADVGRILELYRRQGRFAAAVEPKMVQLDQNRVDIVYEITEGPKSKVRRINIIGNEVFGAKTLRAQMATRQAGGVLGFLATRDTYDPDRLAYDQSKLRQFYLTQGYADFRVISAVAELTPDKRDFILTYVVEEGPRYKFGDVEAESEIRDFPATTVKRLLPMKPGDFYNAKLIEDTVENLTKAAGLVGYAFAQVDPAFNRDREARKMNITFRVGDSPRVYVESVNINGNTTTQDKVIRREFRLAEGDPFNAISVKRSEDRIKSLGFFQEKFEVAQRQGSGPDRIALDANVEEKNTGELALSAGYSSLERFIVSASIRQRNFRGRAQELRASVNYSTYSKSVELGFTEPYLFDRNIAVGFDVFRRDQSSFNFSGTTRNTTYAQTSTGFQLRAGLGLTEYTSLALRYGLSLENVKLDANTYFFDSDNNGSRDTCDSLIAGRYLCDALGRRTVSSIGYSFVYDRLNNRVRPSSGERLVLGQDFAGLGGSVRYLRTTLNAAKYVPLPRGFIFSVSGEGGYIKSFNSAQNPGSDPLRLTDRFFLGEPQIRGFDIRGVGPRVQRLPYVNGALVDSQDRNTIIDEALGGRAYYQGRLELEIPLSQGARELGLRPSIFVDAGAVFGLNTPALTTLANTFTNAAGTIVNLCRNATTGARRFETTTAPCDQTKESTISPFEERFRGNSPRPRVAIGVGVNWNSPFGPFRIDLSKVLLKQPGELTKTFSFNVGTSFQ